MISFAPRYTKDEIRQEIRTRFMRRCHSLTLVSLALTWSGFLVINYHLVSVHLHIRAGALLTGRKEQSEAMAQPTSEMGTSRALITSAYFLTPLLTTPTSVWKMLGKTLANNLETQSEHQTISSYLFISRAYLGYQRDALPRQRAKQS